MKYNMNRPVSRRTFLGGAAGVAALGLAACGGSSDSSSSSSSSDSSSTGTEGGGTITAGSAYSTQNYNPSSTSSALALGTNWHVVEGLYGIDYHDYSTFNELASGDPTQVDDTTFEVTLRDGAKFSDGTDVTPEDVIESFARATAEGNIYVSMLAPIASIEKKDDTTLTITTTVPNFSLLKERLAIVRVVPASSTDDDMTAKPVGSGPWMYDTISDESLELVPNPNYNGDHPAKDEKIHYDILKDATARLTAQQEGSTLVMEMATADAVTTLENVGCTIDNVQGFGTRFMMFDVAKAPWDDVRVRQAVMYALDYDKMIENAFAGLATAPTCYLPETFTNYHKASTVYTHDPDKAKSLIEEAGITPGDITLRTTDNEQVENMAVQVKEDLDALGFNTTIQTDTSSATYSAIDSGDNSYDLLLAPGDPSCFGADPDLLMNWWYGDNVWMNTRCPWSSSDEYKQLSELMAQALEQTGDEQQSTWNECFDIIAENCVLYPVLQVQTVTASWQDTSKAPNGVGIKDFQGIGTTGMSFIDACTVSA
ncbi:MAG: ABC transporter substrate-binding protein [Tractidigestivibacter sp.]|jgi:peptide/nickel transport system substrate-binding protein|uniref:ABC transporter substrate-binding protein n=1 Tax=Tractidigestivibacter sp. TaxID=2847320 RepID=UPI003D908B95